MNSAKRRCLIIGAGIVGLAVAREWLRRYPASQVEIHEKEPDIALHQTGRNSGVIHSGIYYPPGSEKAALCKEAVPLLLDFCARHGIETRRTGKIIVAVRGSELERLEQLFQWGIQQQIPGLMKLTPDEIRKREPEIRGLRALYLPNVSMVNFRAVAQALKKEVTAEHGRILLHSKITGVSCSNKGVRLQTDKDAYEGDYLINCAGLYSDRVALMAGLKPSARIVPFRGEYYYLRGHWPQKIRHLIYPTPDPRFPFLGIHLSPTLEGEVLAGPNAVLAFAREGYDWHSLNGRDLLEMAGHAGFWKMIFRYYRTGMMEMSHSLLKSLYARKIREYLPGLEMGDLEKNGSGVRAQAVDFEGRLVSDFLYLRQEKAIHVLNAPSPAATASLAIAKRIVDLVPAIG